MNSQIVEKMNLTTSLFEFLTLTPLVLNSFTVIHSQETPQRCDSESTKAQTGRIRDCPGEKWCYRT